LAIRGSAGGTAQPGAGCNAADAQSCEQAFDVMKRLGMPLEVIEQQLRRMLFNVAERDQSPRQEHRVPDGQGGPVRVRVRVRCCFQ